MGSQSDKYHGTGSSRSGHLGMGAGMYTGIGASATPYPYAESGHQGPHVKDEVAAAMTQMTLAGYPGGINTVPSSGIMPMGVGNLLGGNQTYYYLPDGRIIPSRLPSTAFQARGENINPNALSHPQVHVGPIHGGTAPIPSHQGMPWNLGSQLKRETTLPDLTSPRRNSHSSNEENGPHTPYFGASSQADAHTKIAVGGSPYPWTTPSPHLSNTPSPLQIAKSTTGQYYFADLTSLCLQEPAIPKPIPAIFSGEKGRGTLEKSLQNNLNTTNVYIRGLHPNTTDEMLHEYGSRFGKIVSAKSMLEQETGNCKGFGFIKYHNFTDGENCIRAFFHWGYEAKWARVSHNEKLKTLGDENNTNLYCSNLPLEFNEHSLMAIFDNFEVLSAKILRDTNGMSRGVGFARFATPDICRKVIEQYNGLKVGDEGFILSIRFADTPEQKKLKSITAERRNYKATEYNTAAYSPGSPYAPAATPAVYNNSPVPPRAMPAYLANPTQLASIYSAYPAGATVAYPASPKVPLAPGVENIDLSARYLARSMMETPPALGLSKRKVNTNSPAKSDLGAKLERSYPLSHQSDVQSSPIKPNKYSPAKSSPSKSQKNMMLRS